MVAELVQFWRVCLSLRGKNRAHMFMFMIVFGFVLIAKLIVLSVSVVVFVGVMFSVGFNIVPFASEVLDVFVHDVLVAY